MVGDKGVAKKWLSSQLTYQLHKPVKWKYKMHKYSLRGVDIQHQADLIDMTAYSHENNGYKWLLTCLDCFSWYAWAAPVKSKMEKHVLVALKQVFAECQPSELFQTDHGKEFDNKHMSEYLKSRHTPL